MHNDNIDGRFVYDGYLYINKEGKPIGITDFKSTVDMTSGYSHEGSYEYEQARTFKRFGTYHPTARQRELFAKKKKKSRHKKKR